MEQGREEAGAAPKRPFEVPSRLTLALLCHQAVSRDEMVSAAVGAVAAPAGERVLKAAPLWRGVLLGLTCSLDEKIRGRRNEMPV